MSCPKGLALIRSSTLVTFLCLSPAKRNYDIGNRELVVVKLALEEWWFWLEGTKEPYLVWTDRKNVEYIRTSKTLNACQAHWSLFSPSFALPCPTVQGPAMPSLTPCSGSSRRGGLYWGGSLCLSEGRPRRSGCPPNCLYVLR